MSDPSQSGLTFLHANHGVCKTGLMVDCVSLFYIGKQGEAVRGGEGRHRSIVAAKLINWKS